MEAESFSPPQVRVGDSVYWYHDPLNCNEPTLGWIVERPGVMTVSVLTFSPNTGFLERPSVRHKDDPGLQENADWRQWGCWDFTPQSAQLRKLDGLMSQIANLTEQVALARKQNGGTKNG
jgi:hypothetical protein